MARTKKGDNNPATPRPKQGSKARAAAGRKKNRTLDDQGKGADALRSERDRNEREQSRDETEVADQSEQ